jgi:6-phosphogluconolactonase
MSEIQQMEILDLAIIGNRAAELVAESARAAVGERGVFNLALSGGRTPVAMFQALSREEFPWGQTNIFQVDERIAPAGDESRNLTLLLESLPEAALARVQAMPVEDPNLEAAALRYSHQLPNRFDLIHLGLGPDGHTASLVPGDSALEVTDRDVALTEPYMGLSRMTMTYPPINRARALLWLIVGADKHDALCRLREGDRSIPAGRVLGENATILADRQAAG